MNEKQFIEKWQGCEEGWWVQTADRLFWVRSYQMDKKDLLEMSLDYLTFSSSTGCRGDKAYRAAENGFYAQESLIMGLPPWDCRDIDGELLATGDTPEEAIRRARQVVERMREGQE